MLNNQDITFDPLAQVALLKQQYGDKADFLSKENFPFNAFDDEWTLNGLGNNGQSISMSWLHNSALSLNDQIIVRLALAGMAKRLAKASIENVIISVYGMNLQGLSISIFKDLWPTLSVGHKSRFNQLIISPH